MELVYLWVEDYKNIQKQGFNFSPRFKCEYDEKSNELTIEEDKEYVSIFPENINVTAIVGENGSGKSAILSSLPFNSEPISYENNILVCYINDTFQIYTKKNISTIYSSKEEILFDFDYISANNDYLVSAFIDDFYSYLFVPLDLNNNLLSEIYVQSNSYIDLALFTVIVNKLIYKYSAIDNLFNYQPERLLFSIRFGEIKNLLEDLRSFLEKESLTDSEISNGVTNAYELLKYYFEEGDVSDRLIIYIFLLIYKKDKKYITLIENLYFNVDLNIKDIKKYLFEYITEHFTELKYLVQHFDFFIDFFQDTENFEKIINIQELKEKYPEQLDLLFQKNEIQKLLKIEFYDINNITFEKLSQGERQIFVTSLAIYEKIQEITKEDILILLDEPDLSLHPQWQKQYLNMLIQNISKFDKKIHLILTSHSPFILSDLPKENVIFLEKGKQVDVDIETFGANIHTLLSHGFFMKDGLMGEFAKGAINKAITKLNQAKLSEEDIHFCENIIKITGEPIIKRQMQKMLDSKRLSKIDTIEKQITKLQEELQKMKK